MVRKQNMEICFQPYFLPRDTGCTTFCIGTECQHTSWGVYLSNKTVIIFFYCGGRRLKSTVQLRHQQISSVMSLLTFPLHVHCLSPSPSLPLSPSPIFLLLSLPISLFPSTFLPPPPPPPTIHPAIPSSCCVKPAAPLSLLGLWAECWGGRS